MRGPQAHLVAERHPTVSALAATAIMAARKDSDQPASLTLMTSPTDMRISWAKVNDLANNKPLDGFESKRADLSGLSQPLHFEYAMTLWAQP